MMDNRLHKKLLSLFTSIILILSFSFSVAAEEPVDADPDKEGFQYVHDPMEYEPAAKDIVENPDAVYGYSPNPESKRLGEFAQNLDFTDSETVARSRKEREEYHESVEKLYELIYQMYLDHKSIEEIAREVSKRRNEVRLNTYRDDPAGLETVRQSNLETYGNEDGPTAEYMYNKYGSWLLVIEHAVSTNPGMDACLGFFDENYELYLLLDEFKAMSTVPSLDTGVGPVPETYIVREGDTLWKLGVLYYDDGTSWKSIYEQNQTVIQDPSLIYPGMVLHMPA